MKKFKGREPYISSLMIRNTPLDGKEILLSLYKGRITTSMVFP